MSKPLTGQSLASLGDELGGIISVHRIGKMVSPESVTAEIFLRLNRKLTLQEYLEKEKGKTAFTADELIVICLFLELSLEKIVEIYSYIREARSRTPQSLLQEIVDS